MTDDLISGKWKQLKGKLRAQWGKLTDDDLDSARGNVQILAGKIQEYYGITRTEAERRLRELEDSQR